MSKPSYLLLDPSKHDVVIAAREPLATAFGMTFYASEAVPTNTVEVWSQGRKVSAFTINPNATSKEH